MNENCGINFCPHCGNPTKGEMLNTPFGNGADWVCNKCKEYVEAYILGIEDQSVETAK